MKAKYAAVALVLGVVLAGCSAYRDSVREFGRSMGTIGSRDIKEAQYIQGNLPAYLGLDQKYVQVEPGSDDTKVSVSLPCSPEEQKAILSKVEAFRKETTFTYPSEPDRHIPCKTIAVSFQAKEARASADKGGEGQSVR